MNGRFASIAGAALALMIAAPVSAQVPEGYPADYGNVIKAAKEEGALNIYSTTDESTAQPLLNEFRKQYPDIKIEYSNLNSTELYNRVISENAAGQAAFDVVWTGGMDTGVRMALDGYAMEYLSPEAGALPSWAVYKNLAYGTTAEPLVFMYNKRLLPADSVPKSHADLLRLIQEKPDLFRKKIAMLDPARTAGLTMNIFDAVYMPNFWDLVTALGTVGTSATTSSGAIMERVNSGELLLGWNLFGSYVELQMRKNPAAGMVLPSDYTLTSSRVAFVSAKAPHPNAAKTFLDFILSKRGQEMMANEALLHAIRTDVDTKLSLGALQSELGDALKPMPVSDELIKRVMDPEDRVEFLRKFEQSMKGQQAQ